MDDKQDTNVISNNKDLKVSFSNVIDTQYRKSLMEFPNEILLHILSYLDCSSLRNTVSFVNKRLRIWAEDYSLWKKLEINCMDKEVNFGEVFGKYPKVQHVIIKYCFIDETRVEILSQLTSLHSLVLHECIIVENCLRRVELPLFAKSDFLTSLTMFSVHNCREFLYNSDPPYLKQLNITFCDRDDKDDFCQFIEKCKHLEELYLKNNYTERLRQYDDNIVNSVFRTRYDTLVSFNINFVVGHRAFITLRSCPKLTKLSIGNCEAILNESTLYDFTKLNKLTELRLRCFYGLSKRRISRILSTSNLCNLTTLEITYAFNLSDSNLLRIAKGCKKLLHLTLANCNILTDDGLSDFARNCSSLIFLSITELNRVTGRFLLDITNDNLKNLETLILDNMYIRLEYVAALKRSRPDLISKSYLSYTFRRRNVK